MKTADTVCEKCGATISGDTTRQVCAACLLETGLGLLQNQFASAAFDPGRDGGAHAAKVSAADDRVPDSTARDDVHFGVYEIERHPDGSLKELGRGAMGVTYCAVDTSLQRKVALKIIKVGIATRSADARERFMREARAAAALRHENIATVYQFGIREDTGQYFYAMELIEGETLEERIHRAGPLDARTTVEIAQQVTAALVVAEKHGLVHRDLKPANLMLVSPEEETAGNDEKVRVKIIDFGLAKALHAPVDPMSLTRGGFVGTPEFASPEQFEHSPLDVRSDIFSLGATLWFALTGKTPFVGHRVQEIHDAQQSHRLPVEQLKAARVPLRLRSLLTSMLALEPTARPSTHDLAARLQLCSAEAKRTRRTRFALAAAAILILGLTAFSALLSLRTQHAGPNLGPPEKSIAVLPFENLSPNPDNVYFADGVQDEILTRLASLADLKVISRTSVMQYKSGAARNLRKIGHQLRVARVVEGSVQRAGNRVRVNAQLIDVSTNRQLWGETYDRDLADVFAIQSEIATSVVRQLQARLSAREKTGIEQAPTNDITAFELYAQGKDLLASRNAEANLLKAADLLNQAVARDPSFFKAYCLLASTHDRLYFLGGDHTPARLALAEAAIEAAFRLHPDAGEAHLARAQNLYRGYLDYDAALAELEVAAKTLPNDAGVFELKGYIQRRQGKQEEAVRSLERAIDLDPRNSFTLRQIALSYRHLRRFAQEKSVLNRALAIEPNDVEIKLERAAVEFYWKADPRPLHQMVDSIRATNPAASADIAEYWLGSALAERDAAAARNAVIAAGENPAFTDEAVSFSRPFMEGVIARMTKNDAEARAAFTAARAEQQKIIQAHESYGPPLSVLGLIDAGLGQREEALREGRRAVELLPVEKDPINGIAMVKYLAMIAAWVGDKDLACEQLAVALRPPSRITYGELKLLPFWDPLRGDPRFEKIVASLAPK
jgi:serine/threonine protein kinase/tetratricopeptide (TPR) repeat protein